MPSSSARCAQLPRAMDKVPFYSALKKFRDYLNGLIPEIDENEVIFNDPKIRAADDGTEISEHLKGFTQLLAQPNLLYSISCLDVLSNFWPSSWFPVIRRLACSCGRQWIPRWRRSAATTTDPPCYASIGKWNWSWTSPGEEETRTAQENTDGWSNPGETGTVKCFGTSFV